MKKLTFFILILLSINVFSQDNISFYKKWNVENIFFYEKVINTNKIEEKDFNKECKKCEKSIFEISINTIKLNATNRCFFKNNLICDNYSLSEDTINLEFFLKLKDDKNLYYSILYDIISENKTIKEYIKQTNVKYIYLNFTNCPLDWGNDKIFFVKIANKLLMYCGSYYLILK